MSGLRPSENQISAIRTTACLGGRRLKTCTTNTHDSIHHNLGILNALGYELHSREVIQG